MRACLSTGASERRALSSFFQSTIMPDGSASLRLRMGAPDRASEMESVMSHQNALNWAGTLLQPVNADNGRLTAFVLTQAPEFVAFSNATGISGQSGVYIVTNAAGRHYVGQGGNLRKRIDQYAFGVMQPERIVAITGQKTPLDPEEAAGLERVVTQSLWPCHNLDLNHFYPHGGRIDDEQYNAIQAGWSSLVFALRAHVPALSKPWLGPEYAHIPAPNGNDIHPGSRRVARRRNLNASIVPAIGGYVVEKGSLIRAQPRDHSRRLSYAVRNECRYAGILVPHEGALKLTRPVHFRTIAACSRFVFDTTETAIWQSPDDFSDFPAA
jgi:hypothetical protein